MHRENRAGFEGMRVGIGFKGLKGGGKVGEGRGCCRLWFLEERFIVYHNRFPAL